MGWFSKKEDGYSRYARRRQQAYSILIPLLSLGIPNDSRIKTALAEIDDAKMAVPEALSTFYPRKVLELQAAFKRQDRDAMVQLIRVLIQKDNEIIARENQDKVPQAA
jgi:hypothetical protein